MDFLINIPSPGVPPKLDATHRAFLARIVEEGPIPAVHGVTRWRACDLIMRLHEEFGLSVSDDTIYRALKNPGFSHLSARVARNDLHHPAGGSPQRAPDRSIPDCLADAHILVGIERLAQLGIIIRSCRCRRYRR